MSESTVDNREFEGMDLEAALSAASAELGIPEGELHYEILDAGRRGVFGLGQKSVRIRIKPPLDGMPQGESAPAPRPRPKRRSEAKPRPPEAEVTPEERSPSPEAVSEKDEKEVVSTVQRMLDLMSVDVNVETESMDGGLNLKLDGADRKMLTNKDGELLFAIQFLLNRMARRAWPDVSRIHLSCDGKRRRRDDDLVELAREVAQQVSRTGKTKKLHPMNAYERRLVHLTVREFSGLSSSSDGRGTLKRVRISKVRNVMENPRGG